MWNPFKKKESEKQFNLALENLFQYWGTDLPIQNFDDHGYINKIWRNIPVVYDATNKIYQKVIKSPLVFYKVKNEKSLKAYKSLERKDTPHALVLKAQALEEVSVPALEKLLEQPNPQQDWNNFVGVWCLSYLLTGNSYTWKNMAKSTKRPMELWAFPDLHIISGGTYNPVKSYSQFFETTSEKNYPAEEIYHTKTPNPDFNIMGNQLYGVSPLRAYLEPLRTNEEANKQASKQMKNGGALVLFSPANKENQLSREQRQEYSEKLREALKADSGFSRFLTSSLSMDVQQVGLSSGDLELLGINSATEENIYKLYNIPLARYSQKSSTQNNQAESNKQMVYDAISPITDLLGHMLTKFVGVHFDNVIIEVDCMQLPEMAINMKEVMEYIVPLVKVGLISREEGRFAFKYGETGKDYMSDFWYDDKPLAKLYDGSLQPNNNNNTNQT